jgi:membrane protein YqaA with SNARE-associated domain
MALAAKPQAERWLAFISFIESSVFPIPPDAMLIPMALAKREKALRFAAICTVASVLGALAGYAIGYFLWESFGQPLFEFYGYMDKFNLFQAEFVKYGAWLVFVFGITFFPFKVITITSGVVALDPLVFLVASLLSRTPRFFIEAWLLMRFGAPIQAFIEKRLAMLMTIAILLGIAGFYGLTLIGD